MSQTTVSVRPVTPVIGAEIAGLDLNDLDDAGFEAIHDALMTHGVLFFRDQDVSIDSQKALGARFGELLVHPNDPGLEGHPEVMRIHADRSSKNPAFVQAVAQQNVRLTVGALTDRSAVLRGLVEEGQLAIVGAMYDIGTGRVSFLD